MRAKVSILPVDRVSPNRGFLILSTTVKPELSMNSLLYTSKARGKYTLKIVLIWQKNYVPPVKIWTLTYCLLINGISEELNAKM